jgi:N-acetylglucosaminyldiphosphoundecaprenol N-acetyl-beta-D-mannosaminyltransferase
MVTPNLDILRQCAGDPELASLVRAADVLVADGMPLVWGSRLQRTPLPERVAGSNLVNLIAGRCAERRMSVLLLGGNPGAAEGAAGALTRRYPGIRVAGTYCPPFGFEKDEQELRWMESMVRSSEAHIVLVGLGFPKQERLIKRLRAARPGAWWLGIGITFSFLSGEVARAPRWMQQAGVEWVHRMAQEPRRLATRYLVHGFPFAVHLLICVLRQRFRGPAGPGLPSRK